MAQHDYNIANQSGSSFRADLNNALSAVVSQNSGSAAPTTTFAYQMWADTTAGVMKLRNGANSAWITLYELDGTFVTTDIQLGLGAAATPSLAFTGDLNTGIYSPGADQVAIATGGTQRVTVDASGRLGVGTASPGALLTLAASVPELRFVDSDNSFYGTITAPGGDIYIDADKGNGAGGSIIRFAVDDSERVRIDSSGRLLVGTSSNTGANTVTIRRSMPR